MIELHDRFRPGCTEVFPKVPCGFDLYWHQGGHLIAARRKFVTHAIDHPEAGR